MAHREEYMLDSPTPFDTLEMWESYLTELRSLPEYELKDRTRQLQIKRAEDTIAEKKAER